LRQRVDQIGSMGEREIWRNAWSYFGSDVSVGAQKWVFKFF
jgi:hypothetical protein